MPRNKASRLRLAQPEPEPEPEPAPDVYSGSGSGESGSDSDAGSVGSADAYEAQLRAIFQRADRNGDGSLRRAELILRLRKDEDLAELLDLPSEAGYAQRKALDALFAGMDASGDGGIDEEEFVRYFADKAAATQAAEAAAAAAAAAAEAEDALSIKERIGRIYEVYNPRKIDQIDALLGEWAGEEEVLYKNIKDKYDVPDDFFVPERPGSAPNSEAASSQRSAEEESGQEDDESAEEEGSADNATRQKEDEEIAARYQWMVDLQQEQDGDSEEDEDNSDEDKSSGEDDEEASDQDQASSDESDEAVDEDDYQEGADDEGSEGSTSKYGTTSHGGSNGSEKSDEDDVDLGVHWEEENLHDIQRRSELIKQAKIFRVKIERDSTGRGTYTSIYAPENQVSNRGKDYKDPEVLRKQEHVDKIAQVGEPKRRKSSGHAKLSDPELAAIAARVRAKICGGSDSGRSNGSTDDGRPERLWQKKLRERWNRPMDDFGMYSVDTEMVQALKHQKKVREEEEAAKTGSLLVPQYEYGNQGGDDNGERSNAAGATAEEDAEYSSEDGEEQEMFRVVRRGNRGRMKMSRVTAAKKKKTKKGTSALTPRAVRNQLMLDKLSDIHRKHAEAAAAKATEENGTQSVDDLSDQHFPRAKANRNINVKHADGSSSWIRKGQVIVITESERGQPYKGYLEGNPQDVGVFLKSRIIIRTEEQLSMFADVSDTIVEDEHESDNDDNDKNDGNDEEAEQHQDLAATGGTEISRASTKRSALGRSSQDQSRPSSITSSQQQSPSASADDPEPESLVGACRFCGFSGPVSRHPTTEFPDCPHEPIVQTPSNDASTSRPPTANSAAAASEKSNQTGSDWSAEIWSALPVGDFFDLRKEPAPSNADLMARVTNPNDGPQASGEQRPMTPENWAAGAPDQTSRTQTAPWAKLMRLAGVKPQPRPATGDALLSTAAAEAPLQQGAGLNATATQKEDDVRAVENRLEKLEQDKDKLFMKALAGVEAVISRATTPQEQVSTETEQQAEAEAEAERERVRARVLAAHQQEAAAATKIAAVQRGNMGRARAIELKKAKDKEAERIAFFKKLRADAEAAAKIVTDPEASAAAAAATVQEEEESAVAAAAMQAAAEDAAIEEAELSDVFVTLDPPPSQIASSVADSFLNAKSGSLLPLNGIAGHAASLPTLTRPKKGLEAARRLPRDPQLWNTEHVCEWLAGLGLEEYRSNFEEQSISGDVLLELTASDLQDDSGLRIARLGHRKLLTKAISQLQYRSESDLTLAL